MPVEKLDTKEVPFGPVSFSSCLDVVVAHGGEPPFTWFQIDENEELIWYPVVLPDFGEIVILDITFMGDCEHIAVLTPDEVIVIAKGNDEPKSEVPLPDDPGEDPSIDYDPEKKEVTVNEGNSSEGEEGGSKPGGSSTISYPDPGNPIPVTYSFYASVHVTYHVTSHRELF